MVADLVGMEPQAWQFQMQHAQQSVAQLSQNIAALHAHISLLDIPVSSTIVRNMSKITKPCPCKTQTLYHSR